MLKYQYFTSTGTIKSRIHGRPLPSLLVAARNGAISAAPQVPKPPVPRGGVGSSPAGGPQLVSRKRTASLGGQPGRGTENWLGKGTLGRGQDDQHGAKGR